MRPMKKNTMRRTLPLLGVAVVLSACLLAAGCTGQTPDGTDNETVQGTDLNGTAWDLLSYTQNGSMKDALAGTTVTLVLGENNTASGSAGCNAYSASYTLDGTAITFGPAVSTLMYCPIEGLMEQESAYLRFLDTVKSYEVKDETLTFFDENGTAVLVFGKHVPPQPEPLVGTDWTLVSYHTGDAIVSVIAGTEVTAVFEEDGKVAGSAGCNRYFASYEVNGTEMTIGPAGSTLMACQKEGVMEQESAYLGLLGTVKTFTIEGETLTFFDENGTRILEFAKAVPPQPEPLVGTNWTLVSYHTGDAIVPVIAGTEITAVFNEDGQVAGSAGCNRYFASYEVNGTEMTIGPAGSTLMACLNEDVAEQESTFLGLLGTVKSFAIEGDRLSLMDENGTAVLVFAKAETPASLPLVGTTWVLDAYHLDDIVMPVIEGTEITAVFDEDGKVTGSAGCNRYFASYNLTGSSMEIGPAGSTKMFCAEPEGIMEQESTYLSLLGAVKSYTIEGDQLELLDERGWRVLAFTAKV
ncbi:META domain-containing protein [Methanofollis formosanus]|uniref:META domain-containing protein n=1 Tax=Methanofollis formosanus TaxID=299308 RepID=A0A8G1A371_9EURY|nr:META domain-containing protein [Methanofollis formosanus]QYZ80332.1 META domain-containing protein [Methanofollis formosanus]